jgi:hypothetical protein
VDAAAWAIGTEVVVGILIGSQLLRDTVCTTSIRLCRATTSSHHPPGCGPRVRRPRRRGSSRSNGGGSCGGSRICAHSAGALQHGTVARPRTARRAPCRGRRAAASDLGQAHAAPRAPAPHGSPSTSRSQRPWRVGLCAHRRRRKQAKSRPSRARRSHRANGSLERARWFRAV